MSELLDKPKGKYNKRLFDILGFDVEWKYVKPQDRSRAQLPRNIIKKTLDGFEKIPIKKDANAQSQQEEQEPKENQEEYLYDFSGCDFLDDVDFQKVTFTYDADFRSATFTCDADFRGAKFTGDASFRYAKFTGEADFRHAKFTGEADFVEAKFTGEADFWGAEFTGNADFSSAEFTGDADFWGAKFTGEADFWGAEFTGEANFNSVTFQEVANFGKSVFKLADFEQSVFKKQAYFLEARIDTLKLEGTHIETSVHFLKSTIKNTDRETARIIKHEYYKLNNNLEAIHWNKTELEEYRKELKERAKNIIKLKFKKLRTGIIFLYYKLLTTHVDASFKENADKYRNEKDEEKQKIKEILDKEPLERLARLVLWFQWWTTRHGTNWLLGIIWILGLNALALGLFSLWWGNITGFYTNLSDFLYLLVNFINPVHGIGIFQETFDIENYELFTSKFNVKFGIMDFLFRAFNISLIYLTVAAFRRLSRTK